MARARRLSFVAAMLMAISLAAAPAMAQQNEAAVPGSDACSGPVAFATRCHAPLTATQERALKPKDSFRECADCPEMMVVPAGSFTMGSPAYELGRYDAEGPQHTVTIRRQFAVGRFHVTRDQFAAFVNESRYAVSKCLTGDDGIHPRHSWRDPGFVQDGSHPVVCVNWNDASAYATWLSKKTGRTYRLMSEAEFEYAARAGTTTPYWWGSDITPEQAKYTLAYDGSGKLGTVPVGSFKPNPFGLYDVHGNAGQWTADCWHSNYKRAPADGSAWTIAGCYSRVVRGGDWGTLPADLRAAWRDEIPANGTYFNFGFRVARSLM